MADAEGDVNLRRRPTIPTHRRKTLPHRESLRGIMRAIHVFVTALLIAVPAATQESSAQSIRLGPGGVEIRPAPEVEVVPEEREPPRRVVRPAPPRDELRSRMFQLREACEDGDRRACVRFGVIIGENRERRAQWRRENPELFSYER
jgi:hypothetical protein